MVSSPTGVLPVLYTFRDAAGRISFDANDAQIDWAVGAGASGITLLGLASEGGAMATRDRLDLVRRAAQRVPTELSLLLTVRPDDDVDALLAAAGGREGPVGLIFQVGPDHAASLEQFLAMRTRVGSDQPVHFGLQLAPGLIATAFSARSLAAYPAVIDRLDFIKAEYSSIEIARDLAGLSRRPALIVGRHGLNILDYLRIGAVGVIPGVDMTGPLVAVLEAHEAGRPDSARSAYGRVAGYVEFAMQDLATVIAVGKAMTALALDFPHADLHPPDGQLAEAIDYWWRQSLPGHENLR